MNRTQIRIAGIIAGILLAIPGAFIFLRGQPERDGVVASLRLPDGAEYMVAQYRNNTETPYSLDYFRFPGPMRKLRWTPEPYYVSFYMRSPGGSWGWCYIDHRARHWRNASMTYDPSTDVITIAEGGRWRAALDRKRSALSIGDGKPIRELAAPQEPWQPMFPFP